MTDWPYTHWLRMRTLAQENRIRNATRIAGERNSPPQTEPATQQLPPRSALASELVVIEGGKR